MQFLISEQRKKRTKGNFKVDDMGNRFLLHPGICLILTDTFKGASAAASTTLDTAGTHYISAVAYNDKGEGTRSTPIAVTVSE